MSADPPESAAPIHVADVKAARGAAWVKQAFLIYRGRPLAWTGLVFGWIAITLGLSIVPLVGWAAAYLLQPVFFASFALIARKQLAGGRPEMGDLFLAFKGNVRSLMGIGAIELFAFVAAMLLMATFVLPPGVDGQELTREELPAQLKGKEWGVLACLAIVAVVRSALWFAPAVIAFHGIRTAHAVRWSVYAVLSNLGAMVVYALAVMGILVLSAFTLYLGLLVAMPVMVISTFVGYTEVFEKPGVPTPA
jgi:uncharacterized membrane protein